LFWIATELNDDQLDISDDGRHVRIHASNVASIDTLELGGSAAIPARVTWSMEWHATGSFAPLGRGKRAHAKDPDAFTGNFAPAFASGTFAGSELGFSFKSNPGANTTRGFAEVGFEKNGSFR
jgi:hypothetical protein